MKDALAILAGLIMLAGYIPYSVDILKGRVKPARSARLMLTLLLIIAIWQQISLGSGWLLAVSVGDELGALFILALSLKHGMDGLSRIDFICYGLLVVDLLLWLTTKSTLLALHLSMVADFISFSPVLIKTWRLPWTETPLFYLCGAVGPMVNLLAVGQYNYSVIIFPVYLGIVNATEMGLIFFRQKMVLGPADS